MSENNFYASGISDSKESNVKPDGEALIKQIDSVGSKDAATKQFPAVDIANYATEKYKRYEYWRNSKGIYFKI